MIFINLFIFCQRGQAPLPSLASMKSNIAKNFDVLVISLSVLPILITSPTKLISDMYLIKFLDVLVVVFFV